MAPFRKSSGRTSRIHLDPVTGMVHAVIGGVATDCQGSALPLEDSVGLAEVDLTADLPGTFGLKMRYDNVEVSVRR